MPVPGWKHRDGSEDWNFDRILESRHVRGKLEYKIKWKGYSDAYNSWEPASHVPDDRIKEYSLRSRPARWL